MQSSFEVIDLAMLVATGLAVLIAFGAALVSYWFYRAEVDPEVIVYTSADPHGPPIIDLIIENIGRGVARNVTFDIPRDLPMRALGVKEPAEPVADGPLITGIPSLGPGSRRVLLWGDYEGLKHAIGNRMFDITVRYRGEARGVFDPHWYESTYPLEIFSFAETDATDTNWSKKTASELANIATYLRHFSTGYYKVHVKQVREKPQRTPNSEGRSRL